VVLDYARGIKQGEIALKMGVSDSAISLILDKFKPAFAELANVEEYRKARTELLESVQLQTLKSIACPDRQASANISQLAVALDVISKNARLERGLSTANVSTQNTVVRISPSATTDDDE